MELDANTEMKNYTNIFGEIEIPKKSSLKKLTKNAIRKKALEKMQKAVLKGQYRIVYQGDIPDWLKIEFEMAELIVTKEDEKTIVTWEE